MAPAPGAAREEELVHLALTDAEGSIEVHPELYALANDGAEIRPLLLDECVPVPEGSDFFSMPGRTPLGWDVSAGRAVPVRSTTDGEVAVALAAFLAPAWVRLMHPATERASSAPSLPLYAYCAVGAAPDGTPVAPAIRVDPDPRQDPPRFDLVRIRAGVEDRLEALPDNRLVEHLTRCALEYGCRAAQNYFLGRWEAPLPIARSCNARCTGCISLQTEGEKVASHDRIGFDASPEEVAELALDHIARVPTGVVSFGQGCEGEPLMAADLAAAAVRLIRSETAAGTVNFNTNGSLPAAVARLAEAGLDSIRVSMNSARGELYRRYHRPADYTFVDVLRSLELAHEAGLFVSLNYLVFPGITDVAEELEALVAVHRRAPLQMIQWRNLNIDPDEYLATMEDVPRSAPMGLDRFIDAAEEAMPGLLSGYFNPALT